MSVNLFIPRRRTRASRPAAFTLVEVSLALGIAVFCLVVVFGLLNVGITTSTTSFEQTVATNILSAVAADLRTTVKSSSDTKNSAVYGLPVPPPATGGAASTTTALSPVYLDASGQKTSVAAQQHYRLNVWMTPGTGRGATLARIAVSWPAPAANPAGTVETVVALDRN